MHIDTSLAHGLARRDLRRVTARCAQAEQSIERLRAGWRNGCYRRKAALRRAISGIDRLLAGAAWAHRSYEARRGGFAGWLVPGQAGEAFTVSRYQLVCSAELAYPLTHTTLMLSMDLHAIARGHQRLQQFAWPDLRRELRTAALLAPVVAEVARRRNWRQFALPAGCGLLIGDVDANGQLYARTFVTDLASRWQAIRTRFDEVLAQCEATLSLDTAGVDYALGCDSGIASQWRDLWCNVGAGAVFGYLQQAYQPARDRQALAWDAARAL